MLTKECLLLVLLPLAMGQFEYEEPLLYDTFPEGFVWGVATSAYQVTFTAKYFIQYTLNNCEEKIFKKPKKMDLHEIK